MTATDFRSMSGMDRCVSTRRKPYVERKTADYSKQQAVRQDVGWMMPPR